jgi:hypothetical protein
MRNFLVFPSPEAVRLASGWAAGVAGDRKDEETAPTEAVACIISVGQEAITEILAEQLYQDNPL